jgi:hypothetical protein
VADVADELDLPPFLSRERAETLVAVARRNDGEHGDAFLGMILSGSVGRGMATARSDLDVHVILARDGGRGSTRSATVDEIPCTLAELAEPAPFNSAGWWSRWSFAWAPVLLDRTGGRVAESALRQATVTSSEAEAILVGHGRLDGWVNHAYRSLKSHRDGRALEARLDAAESVPWLLDTVFTLAGRVRPYHKYLPWELREHPLPGWDPGTLPALLEATLDGDPAALRATFHEMRDRCAAFDDDRGEPILMPIIEDWGEDDLQLFAE